MIILFPLQAIYLTLGIMTIIEKKNKKKIFRIAVFVGCHRLGYVQLVYHAVHHKVKYIQSWQKLSKFVFRAMRGYRGERGQQPL